MSFSEHGEREGEAHPASAGRGGDVSPSILEARDLCVERAGANVLEVPLLRIAEGEVLSLIGPNGAGKSTLLLTLCSLQRCTRGTISFRGFAVGKDYSAFRFRRQVTMVFQEPLLFDTTVFDNVASGLRFRGFNKRETEKAVAESLNLFGVDHLRDRSARKVSGGEAQRVSLARAFALKPEILLLDEPFSSLDPPTRESLTRDLGHALNISNTTTIFATHDRMEALQLSHRIAVMDKGRIVQVGSPEEVMNRPVDQFVASFVGIETILNGSVIRTGEGTFTASVSGYGIEAAGSAAVGEEVILCIRPENVTLSIDSGGAVTSARNMFHGIVGNVTPLGPYLKVLIDCGFHITAYVTKSSLETLSLKGGQPVTASFKATAIHVVRRI
ncbi:MAG: ABC transporter ATP-binding protein [Syntrophus sp. (in: bacteria)]|nr:ABC transporter ATP-binding protein [Syntrophus sp. (in: bacteria)]